MICFLGGSREPGSRGFVPHLVEAVEGKKFLVLDTVANVVVDTARSLREGRSS